jgi:nucleoside-diphosphate-sugar epimerase
MERILISGASGVLGSALVRELGELLSPSVELVGVIRRRRDDAALDRLFGPSQRRWRLIVCDLTDEHDLRAAIKSLPAVGRALGVHLAADVAWNKPLAEMIPLNVQGSLNFSRLLRETSRSVHLIYTSTAYSSPAHRVYRNSYEESKALGEAGVRNAFVDLPMTTFSCSLVLGNSRTGEISRFHGVYPLLRYAASFPVPFWVCDDGAELDMVPLDWTVEQLKLLVLGYAARGACPDVVASAGSARLPAREIIAAMYVALNDYRSAQGLQPMQPPPLINSRRWHFLRRSMMAWGKAPTELPSLRYFEHLMESYRCYLSNGPGVPVLDPKNVSRPAPDPRTYLHRVFSYWLESARPAPWEARRGRQWSCVSR